MKVQLADEAQIAEGTLTEVDFFGRPAILLKLEGRLTAYLNVCTHPSGPLALEGDALRCQWHGACFAAWTGKRLAAPAPPDTCLIRLPIKVEEGRVFYVYGEERAATIAGAPATRGASGCHSTGTTQR